MGGFGHEQPGGGRSNDWITPPGMIAAFDSMTEGQGSFFFLDPRASVTQPWPCARKTYTVEQDGLTQPWWGGSVWCNPPYGPHTKKWITRLAEYGDGVALIYARTDTRLWQQVVFPTAAAYLYIAGRVQFYLPNGELPRDQEGRPQTATAPSALIAWGERCYAALAAVCERGLIQGAFSGPAQSNLEARNGR